MQFFVVGPTAVGKSRLALDVAAVSGAEIVNADAFQIYRGLDLLTAKPDADAQRNVSHHLLSAVELTDTMSAVRFRELALKALADIDARGKSALVVSGSGLYVKALVRGFDDVPPPNLRLREKLSASSAGELTERLREICPELADRTDLKNRRRVIRAIEIAEERARSGNVVAAATLTHKRVSLPPTTAAATTTDPSAARSACAQSHGVFLVRDRDDLYARINERMHAMFRDGVEEEVAALKNIGPTAAQALGLREIQQLLAREISRDECIERIQQKTRRYAKRQLTWFRHQTSFAQLNLTALSHHEAVSAITRAIAPE